MNCSCNCPKLDPSVTPQHSPPPFPLPRSGLPSLAHPQSKQGTTYLDGHCASVPLLVAVGPAGRNQCPHPGHPAGSEGSYGHLQPHTRVQARKGLGRVRQRAHNWLDCPGEPGHVRQRIRKHLSQGGKGGPRFGGIQRWSQHCWPWTNHGAKKNTSCMDQKSSADLPGQETKVLHAPPPTP